MNSIEKIQMMETILNDIDILIAEVELLADKNVSEYSAKCAFVLLELQLKLDTYNQYDNRFLELNPIINQLKSLMQKTFYAEGAKLLCLLLEKVKTTVYSAYRSVTYNEETYSDIILDNYYETEHSKNALIIYIVTPFLLDDLISHTNQNESRVMASIINRLGYNVDIASFLYKGDIPSRQYDLVIGFGNLYDILLKGKQSDTIFISYLTESNPYFANMQELNRLRMFEKRNGRMLSTERMSLEHLDVNAAILADAAICLGNKVTVASWNNMYRKIVSLNATGFSSVLLTDLHRTQESKNNYLWYAGAGPIHKGLDICIEAFRKCPALNLYIVGSINKEFYEFYKRDIEESKNIFFYGYLNKDSLEFHDILENCQFCICPSCSEGQATAVLTTLFAGMIPFCTKEIGIDVEEIGGFLINDISIDAVCSQLCELSVLDDKEIEKREKRIYEYAVTHHTLKNYEENLEGILYGLTTK